jgi:hypothetical protein
MDLLSTLASDANDPDTKGAGLEGEVGGEIFNCAKCGADCSRSGHVGPSWATADENDDAGALLDHMAGGSAGGDKRDLTIVANGTMNWSIGKSTASLPFPYSLVSGPAASRIMSTLPVCFTMPSMRLEIEVQIRNVLNQCGPDKCLRYFCGIGENLWGSNIEQSWNIVGLRLKSRAGLS